MPATYEPIASTTLGSNATNVTFSSIPSIFTDLVLVTFARSTTAGPGNIMVQLNSDTGSNYSDTVLVGEGGVAASSRRSSQTVLYGGAVSGNSQAWSVSTYNFMSYSSSSVFKTVLASSATPQTNVTRRVSMWRSTSAVTAMSLSTDVTSFATGSTFSLYGIKAA